MSKSNDEDDPVDELEIGESTEVEATSQYSFWGTTASDDFCGFDREVSDLTLDDARLVGEDGNEEVIVSFSGEVTKVEVPQEVVERRESFERTREQNKWLTRAGPVAALAIVYGVVLGVAYMIPTFEFSVNGNTAVYDPTLGGLVVVALVTACVGAVMLFGLKARHPGHNGGLQ